MSYRRNRSTKETIPTRTEWRKQPVDRSKRVAPGCKIETNNIQHGTRKRKDFFYKYAFDDYTYVEGDDQYVFPIQERKPRKSNNTQERREERYNPYDPQSVKEFTQKMKEMRRRKKDYREKKGSRKPKQSENIETLTYKMTNLKVKKDTTAKETTAKKPLQNTKTRVGRRRSKKVTNTTSNEGLSKSVVNMLKKLNLKYTKTTSSRDYNGKQIPTAIQQFLDYKTNNFVLNNEELAIEDVELNGEYLLKAEEVKEYAFLKKHKDFILIGEGYYILAARLSDTSSDFTIYALDDDNKDKVKATFKLSEFLKTATIGELPEYSEDEMNED